MIIANIRSRLEGENWKWSADVTPESEPARTCTIYFDVPARFECDPLAAAGGFLVSCAPFCLKNREPELRMESEVDPTLVNGLDVALSYLAHWGSLDKPEITVPKAEGVVPKPPGDCASFLSGGVDSLATLARNHDEYPPTHPMRVRHGILIEGLDIGYKGEEDEGQRRLAREANEAIEAICHSTGIEPVLVRTNIRTLDTDSRFYAKVAHGAILAGAALFLSGRISRALISSTHSLDCLEPWGSSPLLDHHYSSTHLDVRHDSEDLTRLQKVALIGSNDLLVERMRVCPKAYKVPDGFINCGQCDKCVLTRLELLAVGISDPRAFPPCDDFDRLARREKKPIKSEYRAACYRELVSPLAEAGHDTLARYSRKKLLGWSRRRLTQRARSALGLLAPHPQRVITG